MIKAKNVLSIHGCSRSGIQRDSETHDHAWYAKKGYLNSGFWHLRWVVFLYSGVCSHG